MRHAEKDTQAATTPGSGLQVWGCQDGDEPGQVRDLFRQGYIAIGWGHLGDFTCYQTPQDFKDAVEREYPNKSNAERGSIWSQSYAFAKKMQIGDLIVTPPRSTPNGVWIGRVTGGYQYRPDLNYVFPMVRRVKWLYQDVRWSDLTSEQRRKWSLPRTLYHIDDPSVVQLANLPAPDQHKEGS